MRAWARTDATAKATLEDIDARRLTHLEDVLKQIGVTNPDIARLLYAARIGMGELGPADEKRNHEALDTLVDLVLALR